MQSKLITGNCLIIVMGKCRYYSLLMMGAVYTRYLTWFEAFVTNLQLAHSGAMEFIDNDALDFLSFQNHTVQLLKQWRKPS